MGLRDFFFCHDGEENLPFFRPLSDLYGDLTTVALAVSCAQDRWKRILGMRLP
jgi:hypothetical protein